MDKQQLKNKFNSGFVILDGAMGTMIQNSGFGGLEIPETLNLTNPLVIEKIHSEYVNAGAEIILANTFGANAIKTGKNVNAAALVESGIKIAKKAAQNKAHVALDIGPTGGIIGKLGTLSFNDMYNAFKETVISGKNAGCDLVFIETMTDLNELRAALLAVKENSDLFVVCCMTFEENGRTFFGVSPKAFALAAEALGADAVGVNCSSGFEGLISVANEIKSITSLPLVIKPNAGLPDMHGNYGMSPSVFADEFVRFIKCGANICGGCCGTTPDHIAALKKMLLKKRFKNKNSADNALYLSSAQTVIRADKPLIIGERLNPTGKKLYKEALMRRDYSYICMQAMQQEDAGAHILDLNVGVAGENETELMLKSIEELSSVTSLPLTIDSSNSETIEYALRNYAGKAIVNSVNGEDETLHRILPLVKKYGAAVIGLTLDNRGIPKTARDRIKIADKIINAAINYGIELKNIIIDTLTLTAAAEQNQAVETLNAIKILKRRGVKTVLGVSNISFGLPERESMNAAFLASALAAGLDFAIINPNSTQMRSAFLSSAVLFKHDEGAREYISVFSNSFGGGKIQNEAVGISELPLLEIIKKGLKGADAAANKLLENFSPLEIINNHIIIALDDVGRQFEEGKLFLPQLLASAESAKSAFESLKQKMPKGEGQRGTIVLATVKGDIHDIGKNIVKTVLENYGFNIIDLGKNAEPEIVVAAAIKYNAGIVGLSALMTTTLKSMSETLKLLKEKLPDCKVMVGGAVVTQEYADLIGADFYGKDAVASANYAKKIFNSK